MLDSNPNNFRCLKIVFPFKNNIYWTRSETIVGLDRQTPDHDVSLVSIWHTFGRSGIIHRSVESVPASAENPPSALPDTSIPSSHLSRRRKTEAHSDARNPLTPRDCNNLFSSLHSSIPNTFPQKQIYGNPPPPPRHISIAVVKSTWGQPNMLFLSILYP